MKKEKLKISEDFEHKILEEEDAANYYIAREILQEIRNFGVSQTTTLKLIELLALELEDRKKMLAIVDIVKKKTNLEDIETSVISE